MQVENENREMRGRSVSVNFKDVSYRFPVFYILTSRISQNLFSFGGTSRMLISIAQKEFCDQIGWEITRLNTVEVSLLWNVSKLKMFYLAIMIYNDIIWPSGIINIVFQTCLNVQCFPCWFFDRGKRAKLLEMGLFGTYFGKMLGHALLHLHHCLLVPQGNSRLFLI